MPTTIILLFTLVLLQLAGYLVFSRNSDARFKRRYFPPFVTLSGLLVVLIARDGWWLAAPLVLLVIYRQIKSTQFCDFCGATSWMPQARFCATCGARLTD
jgi:hypothetical protein